MEKHLYHGNSTGLSGANNLISSSVSNLVVFLYESLVCLEVICMSYSILCIHRFAPVLQESTLLWIIWRKSAGAIENCRMTPAELEKPKSTHSLFRNNMPKILTRKKGKTGKGASHPFLYALHDMHSNPSLQPKATIKCDSFMFNDLIL